MKKHLILAIALLASFCIAGAQQTWFPTKVGAKLTYSSLDKKGKVSSMYTYTVTDVTSEGGKLTVLYDIDTQDSKGTSSGVVIPGKVWSAEGYFHADAKASLAGVVNLDAVKIKGHAPIMPENPGNETLENCKVTIEELMTELHWTNIRMTKGQTVTTPAGTFDDAVLVEYDSFSKIAFIKVNSSVKEWYVKGIGIVRSEMYSQKGQLTQSRELVSIEN